MASATVATAIDNKFVSFSGKSRDVVGDTVRKADFSDIPIISLLNDKDQLVKQIKDACTRVGFFYISDHGVPSQQIDNVLAAAEVFFKSSAEDKREVHFSKSKHFRGYEGYGDNKTEVGKRPDLNEQFNWGYEAELDPVKTPEDIQRYNENKNKNVMAGENAWPSKVPELKAAIAEYYASVLTLARKLIKLFALALDLPEDYFEKMFETPGAIGRILHYFPQDPAEDNLLGIGAHTDIECFTILHQGQVPALQVLNSSGEWIQAIPVEGTFVINIGDMLARWSNDVFISTVHRVSNITGKERYSIPMFIGTEYSTIIEPLPTCIGDGPKYEPIKAGDYVFNRLAFSRLDKDEYEKQAKGNKKLG